MLKLKEIRESNKLTQKAMAEKLEVSDSYYQQIEGGFKQPSYNFIRKFKECFPNVSSEIFFEQNIT